MGSKIGIHFNFQTLTPTPYLPLEKILPGPASYAWLKNQ